MTIKCFFCNCDVDRDRDSKSIFYNCLTCGGVNLTEEAAKDFKDAKFTDEQKAILRIGIRNESEIRGKKPPQEPMTIGYLKNIIEQYSPKNPLDKLDKALLNIDKASNLAAQEIKIKINCDFPYYFCAEREELCSILHLLLQEKFINAVDLSNPHNGLSLSVKGYQRLRDIRSGLQDSRQCFVAMWFGDEMNDVYKKAIKPAIEYIEDGETQPRFKAIKIDNVEHINDINDEIIAQIRRSRFMVCDLTGYRSGVYFEAGFAYGLGIDVIYTCREDWSKDGCLFDKRENLVKQLFDENGKEIEVRKDGVHFDLAHRNQIKWTMEGLEDLKSRLTKRIQAIIV